MSGNNHIIADEGDTVLLTVVWRTPAGVLATPTTTTFVTRTPSQTAAQSTSVTTGWTAASVGVQTRNVVLSTEGLWQFECRGAGASIDDVQTFAYDVRKSMVA
jgi:hypothetical protein